MKYLNEFREPKLCHSLLESIKRTATQKWHIMEVCGGQTHAFTKFGLIDLLPEFVELIHGPGCPVCVTPMAILDHAIELASHPDILFCTFGDMLRVPGSDTNLLSTKAKGGHVRMVYSPLDALALAVAHPKKEVVFLGIGFETTAPANAFALSIAKKRKIPNFSMLCSQVLVPPALKFMMEAPYNKIDGFLAAGHVCTVMGYRDYHTISQTYTTPIVVTGFEPLDLLKGILSCVTQLENKQAYVDNQYTRCVREKGNLHAMHILSEVFDIQDQNWRGLGQIPLSGLKINDRYADYDASKKFPTKCQRSAKPSLCISGQILTGQKKPNQCPAFGKSCTPEHPLGAPMVSTEGACSAYYLYQGNTNDACLSNS